MSERIRTIIAEIPEEMEVKMENGVISSDHLHLLVVILPHVAVSDFVQRAKGRSLRKVQQEFPELNKIYWGRRFWEEDTLVLPVDILQMKLLMSTSMKIRTPISLTIYLAQEIGVALASYHTSSTTYNLSALANSVLSCSCHNIQVSASIVHSFYYFLSISEDWYYFAKRRNLPSLPMKQMLF